MNVENLQKEIEQLQIKLSEQKKNLVEIQNAEIDKLVVEFVGIVNKKKLNPGAVKKSIAKHLTPKKIKNVII